MIVNVQYGVLDSGFKSSVSFSTLSISHSMWSLVCEVLGL